MNTPIAPTILPDSNFSSSNVTTLGSENLILKTSTVNVINNLTPINLLTKQGTLVVSDVNLNVDEFIIFEAEAQFITENSLIFLTILSADTPLGLITNPLLIMNGIFSVRIQNIGPAILTNETVKLAYMIIN